MAISLQPILSSYLYLVFLPALVSGILFSRNRRSNSFDDKNKKFSIYLIYLTTALLTISQLALAFIMVQINTDFEIVINSAGSWMTNTELIAASWTDRWGSYHLWTWFTWIAISLIFRKYFAKPEKEVKNTEDNSLFFEILLWGSILILFLLMGQRPYRAALADAVPIGMSPSLLSIWNFMHPPLAFASYTGFFIIWAITSYFWMKAPDPNSVFSSDLLKLDRIVTRITWVLTSLVLTLGIIWSHEASWGGYWSWDGVIVISIVLWLTAGYRLHLHEVGSNRALYLLLGIIGFPLVFFAAWLITSNILGGLHNYAPSPVASLFLVLFFISLIPLVMGWITHKWQPLSPVRVSDDIAKPNGFNIGVLSFNFLILANLGILLFQILDSEFNLDRDFTNSYPLVNGIGFMGITVGLLLDSLEHKYIGKIEVAVSSVIALILSQFYWLQHIDFDFSEIVAGLVSLFQIISILLIVFTLFALINSEINRWRMKRKITPRRLVSHLAMLLVFLTIIANGAGPATETRVSSDPYILLIGDKVEVPDGLIVELESIEGPIKDSRGETVIVHLKLIKGDTTYTRTISVIDQNEHSSYVAATWITYPNGKEIYFNLKRGQPLRHSGLEIIGIHLIVEEYYLAFPIWGASLLFALIVITPSKLIPRIQDEK
ncbi:MAG: cytochrome c biogenesis protein CcsA [Candidatus Heimdallarchaeota archaeon]|nr:cytochrome c biogenesis protein CcsA [Candidatus Heimdallarchaeota archaeon]